jgi:biopolymer transport protein ExbB
MTPSKLFDLANASGGTLYLMAVLLLVALTVIIERSRYLSKMQQDGESLIDLLHDGVALNKEDLLVALQKHDNLPHASVVHASLIEPEGSDRDSCAGHWKRPSCVKCPP